MIKSPISFSIHAFVFGLITVILMTAILPPAADAKGRLKWVKFYMDKKPHVTGEISDKLSYGVAADVSGQRSHNLNLGAVDDEDEDEIDFEADLGLLFQPSKTFRSYLEFNLSFERNSGNGSSARDVILDVNEAYIAFLSKNQNQALTLGRWSVSDDREWLFGEELDGVHFFSRGKDFAFEVMYAREQILKKDLLDDHDDNEPDYAYARAYANLPGDAVGSLFGLYQMGRDPGDADLLWLGASFAGSTESDIEYWVEMAHVRGTEKGRTVRGYGVDAGLTKTFMQFRANPRLTAAIAFGSGDNGTGTDTGFRQTGIQDNEARFGGRKSIKYYGEVFDPELNNLTILTLGAGVDAFKHSSIDFMYHYSFQNRRSAKIRDSNLDQNPSGTNRHLGHEIDLVVALREFENLDIDLIGGVFFPGAAFSPGKDPAYVLGIQFSMEF
jgi:hypothetical protein